MIVYPGLHVCVYALGRSVELSYGCGRGIAVSLSLVHRQPGGQLVDKADEQEVAGAQLALRRLRIGWVGGMGVEKGLCEFSNHSTLKYQNQKPSKSTTYVCTERSGRLNQKHLCFILLSLFTRLSHDQKPGKDRKLSTPIRWIAMYSTMVV